MRYLSFSNDYGKSFLSFVTDTISSVIENIFTYVYIKKIWAINSYTNDSNAVGNTSVSARSYRGDFRNWRDRCRRYHYRKTADSLFLSSYLCLCGGKNNCEELKLEWFLELANWHVQIHVLTNDMRQILMLYIIYCSHTIITIMYCK